MMKFVNMVKKIIIASSLLVITQSTTSLEQTLQQLKTNLSSLNFHLHKPPQACSSSLSAIEWDIHLEKAAQQGIIAQKSSIDRLFDAIDDQIIQFKKAITHFKQSLEKFNGDIANKSNEQLEAEFKQIIKTYKSINNDELTTLLFTLKDNKDPYTITDKKYAQKLLRKIKRIKKELKNYMEAQKKAAFYNDEQLRKKYNTLIKNEIQSFKNFKAFIEKFRKKWQMNILF